MPAALPSHHYARFTLCRPSLRRLRLDFTRAIVPSSDCLGQKQLQVPLKEEMAERPLFRRCKSTVRSVKISEEDPGKGDQAMHKEDVKGAFETALECLHQVGATSLVILKLDAICWK